MYAENQAVLDEMSRDEEECRINEKAVARTKDQDKEYVELDEVLIVSEKQGVAEEETQKEKESAQVGNLLSEKEEVIIIYSVFRVENTEERVKSGTRQNPECTRTR